MELRQLQYLVALSEELSFGRAAVREHLAPAAFSEQIKRLERELGLRLVERTTRSVRMTDAGAAVVASARQVLSAQAELRRTAARLVRAEAGVLRLGLAAAVADVTAAVVGAYRRRYPDVRIEAVAGTFADPSAGLAAGEVDAALVWAPYRAAEQRLHRLRREPRLAILPADHPLAGRADLVAADLLGETWCDVPTDDPVWRAFWLLDDWRVSGPAARLGGVADSPTGLVDLVAAGHGIGLLPHALAAGLPAAVRAVPVLDVPPCEVAVAVPIRPGPAAAAFAELAVATAAAGD